MSFWNREKPYKDPTRQELLDAHWLEFIDWIQDAKIIRNLAPPYDVYTDIKSAPTPRNVAFINENNFWLWYADVKWDKLSAKERNIKRNNKQS